MLLLLTSLYYYYLIFQLFSPLQRTIQRICLKFFYFLCKGVVVVVLKRENLRVSPHGSTYFLLFFFCSVTVRFPGHAGVARFASKTDNDRMMIFTSGIHRRYRRRSSFVSLLYVLRSRRLLVIIIQRDRNPKSGARFKPRI